MSVISVTFISITDGSELDVELQDSMTADQVIQSLIDVHFLPSLENDPYRSYQLSFEGANIIPEKQTLASAGAQSNDRIRVYITQRGGGPGSVIEDTSRLEVWPSDNWPEIKEMISSMNIKGKQATNLSEITGVPSKETDELLVIHLSIVEEPLTAQNVATILSALIDIYTKSRLIARGRFAELVAYTQTRNRRFVEEDPLMITKLTYNSPANIDLKVDASPRGVMEAIQVAIDMIMQAPHRLKKFELENLASASETKLKELEAQSIRASEEQSRQLEIQKAELEKQKALLEIEKQRLEIEKQQLALQKERLELETKRIDYALETADKMVNELYPEADSKTRAMLLQTLLPEVLLLSNTKGLTLVLPASTNESDESEEQ